MEINIAEIIVRMIEFSDKNLHDIEHFLKVYSYARTIGSIELNNEASQQILETAAVLHDIACPLCREKYGKAEGHLQELEGAPLAESLLASFELPKPFIQQVVWLVSHHHTLTNVNTLEHQILLEADFLVNAAESNYTQEQIQSALRSLFRTKTGIALLHSIYIK